MESLVDSWWDWPFLYWAASLIAVGYAVGFFVDWFVKPSKFAVALFWFGLIMALVLLPVFPYAKLTAVLFFLSFPLQAVGIGSMIRNMVVRNGRLRL
jgi:hypothetical protein